MQNLTLQMWSFEVTHSRNPRFPSYLSTQAELTAYQYLAYMNYKLLASSSAMSYSFLIGLKTGFLTQIYRARF